jgi:hypothetical protein
LNNGRIIALVAEDVHRADPDASTTFLGSRTFEKINLNFDELAHIRPSFQSLA